MNTPREHLGKGEERLEDVALVDTQRKKRKEDGIGLHKKLQNNGSQESSDKALEREEGQSI